MPSSSISHWVATCCFHDFVTLFTHLGHVLKRNSCKINVSGVYVRSFGIHSKILLGFISRLQFWLKGSCSVSGWNQKKIILATFHSLFCIWHIEINIVVLHAILCGLSMHRWDGTVFPPNVFLLDGWGWRHHLSMKAGKWGGLLKCSLSHSEKRILFCRSLQISVLLLQRMLLWILIISRLVVWCEPLLDSACCSSCFH
jgi:hypothetical protein